VRCFSPLILGVMCSFGGYVIYKYLPYDRVDVLENLKIRFSPLKSLNDPFEELFLIDMSLEYSERILELDLGLEKLWSNSDESDKTEENRKILEAERSKLLNHLNETFCPDAVGKELMSYLGDHFGILSLSRTNTSLLMWSHYASEGKGFIIAFDENHPFFCEPNINGEITKPIPVVYSSKRRKVLPNDNDYYQKLLCEKPLEWAYEEEERVFRTFISKEGAICKDDYGQDVILSDLPADAIMGVYLGYRASDDTKAKILSAIKSNDIKCTIYNSKISKYNYRVVFNEVKNT